MADLVDLTEHDRLLVVSGTEREYRSYLDTHVMRHTPLRPDRVRRLRYINHIKGWRGPGLYYARVGTWDHMPYETGFWQILRQVGAEELRSNARPAT